MKTVIGVVGEAGSGKSEVARIFEDLGCYRLSLSDVLRDIASKVGLSHSRDNLINLGNTLRENFGPSILAIGIAERIQEISAGSVVVESIRNPAELMYLRDNFESVMIGVSMSEERKFQLMLLRGREGDPKTWEEYLAFRERELGMGSNSSGIDVESCMRLCDMTLINDGSLSELREKVMEVKQELNGDKGRRL